MMLEIAGKKSAAFPVVFLGLLLLSFGSGGNPSSALAASPGEGSRIAILPESYDFGTIPRRGGTVKATFTVQNEGRAPLKIVGIKPT